MIDAPPTARAVVQLLAAPYLTDEERASLRVEHGLWTRADVLNPRHAARAALIDGRLDAPALSSPEADPLDRAEGMARRGEFRAALSALEGDPSIRAMRLRAEAHEALGEHALADAAVDPVVTALTGRTTSDADEIVDGVLALMVRTRLRGPSAAADAGADYRTMLQLLGEAHQKIDRVNWRARLVEARLLAEKSNPGEARDAILEALKLNPRIADAWTLLGQLAIDSFAFPEAEAIAGTIGALAPGSPDAAILRARARLRQNDPDGAWSIIEPALGRFPDHRELRAVEAAIVASWFDAERLSETLAAFDERNGTEGSPDALLEVGIRLAEARQYAEGTKYLRLAIDRAPNRADGWTELGLMELQAGRDSASLDALRRAAALDPFNTRVTNTLKLVEEMIAWPTIESEHFVIRYQPGIDEVLAREMPRTLERIHDDVAGAFDHEPGFRTTIDLMPDHAAFAVRITGIPRLHTVAAATGPAIAMESPQRGPGFSIGYYDWARTLQHEYAHTVTLSRTHNRIPHWFTEAAAVWAEAGPRASSWWDLLSRRFREGTLFSLDEISVKFVRPDGPDDRTLAYAQGHWMYEFMVERWGPRAPLELMDRYASGEREASAMEAVLGVPPEIFTAAFMRWAEGELRERGLLLPDGVPGLETLVLREAVNAQLAEARVEQMTDLSAAGGIDALTQSFDSLERAWTNATQPTRAQLDRWLARYPGHPDVLLALIATELRLNDGEATPDLVPLLEQYAEARPEDPLPHRTLARLALEGRLPGGAEAALSDLEFLSEREMYTPAYARALAERYAELGDLDRAGAEAEHAVGIAPFDAETREFAARVAIQAQHWDDAERHLLALTGIEPDRDIHQRRLDRLREMRK